MCGIAGLLTTEHGRQEDLAAQVERMAATLQHRGPDGSGHWVDAEAGVAMGHRRLAILDLSPAGAQPMVSHSGRYVLVYNGEIYNHQGFVPDPAPYKRLRWKSESMARAAGESREEELALSAFTVVLR